MSKEVKFSLIYRDMWQSSGKYQPSVEELEQVAPAIIAMGCFDRIETNGGAFEQVCLMRGVNPNEVVRRWTKPFNQAGIETHMLERALNALRMYGVPSDVRRLMPKVKKAQGVDIMRSFCGLNDPRNLEPSIRYAREAGMTSQAALSITHSPLHTAEYYTALADQLADYGAQEICLKDMAGIGRPSTLATIVKQIKQRHPNLKVQYHGHTGPGLSMASVLAVCEAGCDYVDCAIEPLSWGMVHPDVISVQAMLRDAGFLVKDINMKAYMEARRLTQSFIDSWLGLYINPSNRVSSSLLLGCGLPGGMMGSMMSDLRGVHDAINMAHRKQGNPEVSFEELTVQLFQEVEHIWPLLGYPPLVTPFSQYVKNIAVMNLLSLAQGKERFSQIDKDSWSMILGRSGRLPGSLAEEIIKRANARAAELRGKLPDTELDFYTGDPQAAYPDALPQYIKEMEENGWDRGADDEELFEFAMHDRQYRDYRSGIARQRFDQEIAQLRAEREALLHPEPLDAEGLFLNYLRQDHPHCIPVVAQATGRLLWSLNLEDKGTPPAPGRLLKQGEALGVVEAAYGLVPLQVEQAGRLVDTCIPNGHPVCKGDTIGWIDPTH